MSDLERTVQIIFEAVDSLTGPLTDMSSSLSDFGANAETASGEATDLGDSITSVPAEVDIGVEVTGDYAQDFDAIEEYTNTLTDMECVQIDIDAGMALEDIELLSNDIEELPEDITIDVGFEDTGTDKLQAEIDLLEAKQRAIESGEGLIKIDSTGLEPVLEEILWQILEKVQIRAVETKPEFLLGLPV